MSSRPWYQWFPADYLQDTAHLTVEEDCLYRRLLDIHWRDGSIPFEPGKIRRAARFSADEFERAWPEVSTYFNNPGGHKPRLVNKRMKILIASCYRGIKQKVHAANARWNKDLHAGAMQTQCDPDPDPDPEEEEEKKITQKKIASQGAQKQSPRQQETKPRKSPPATAPVVPDGLDLEAWKAYEDYRRESGFRKLKPESITRLMRWLVQQPDQAAVVDHTIRNGWTGLFKLNQVVPISGRNQRNKHGCVL